MKKQKEVWIIIQDNKGYLKPKKVLKTKAGSVQTFSNKQDAETAIGSVYIDQPYS